MALDKQRILSELGSVMNQLQSADCGCMGKLFSNNGPPVNSVINHEGCRRSCCHSHHSCNPCGHAHAGTYGSSEAPHVMTPNSPCMGKCNPPKLYADTYSYLNKNLMQPVVKEVYEDLKSISPANTILNNPIGNQLGVPLPAGSNSNTPAINNPGLYGTNVPHLHLPVEGASAMGPQILNMVSGNSHNVNNMNKHGQNIIDPSNTKHHSPGNYNMQANNVIATGLVPENSTQQHAQMNPKTSAHDPTNLAVPQMASNPHTQQRGVYGQGVTKFNDMFPGVMQGVGGDLGFDPMSIAIQMNPANQKAAAVNAMHKLMNGGGDNKINYQNTQQPVSQPYAMPESTPTGHTLQSVPPTLENLQAGIEPGSYSTQNNQPEPHSPQVPREIKSEDEQNIQHKQIIPNQPVPNQQQQEPVYPVTKEEKIYQYNTFGLPVEMVPAKLYQRPLPNLPQTLAPQPVPEKKKDITKFSNVKSTISKTSIVGNKTFGKTPSRNQLLPAYSQYKGSQSSTRQNIQDLGQVGSASEGHLQSLPPQRRVVTQAILEPSSGDMAEYKQNSNKKEDAKAIQPSDVQTPLESTAKGEVIKSSKCRNGLQDMVYTSYPSSSAWSFHGNRRSSSPISPRSRGRF